MYFYVALRTRASEQQQQQQQRVAFGTKSSWPRVVPEMVSDLSAVKENLIQNACCCA